MKIIAYTYTDPLFESVPNASIWGWEVDRVYIDLGDRQQLQALLSDSRNDPPAYVLVRRLEELGNSVQEVGDRLSELEVLGINLIAVEEPVAGHQPTVRRSDLVHLLQAIQSQQQSRRIRRGHARNRVKALPPPGKAPFGYRRGKDRYTIDRPAAAIVKDFFEHFLLYGSLRSGVRYLESKHRKKISVSTGKRWLTNPVYRGDLEYNSGEVISDTHTPIISRQEAAQVDRLLRRNRSLPPRTASAPRSLSGLVQCAICQSPLTITRVTGGKEKPDYLYLRPARCTQQPRCRAISYSEALDRAIAQICDELPRAVSGLQMPPMDAIKQGLAQQIDAQQQKLDQLAPLVNSGILDQETAELRSYRIRTAIAQLQNQLSQLPPIDLKATVQLVSIPQFWLDLSEAERRFYFREFIRQIEFNPPDKTSGGRDWSLSLIFIF